MFQSYQFRQINPDSTANCCTLCTTEWFQSYQFSQINPDKRCPTRTTFNSSGFQSYQFRQINPDLVQDPTRLIGIIAFQSYQFRQINPDYCMVQLTWYWKQTVSIVSIQADQSRQKKTLLKISLFLSFNRINSGRSIPTWQKRFTNTKEIQEFQSYQFRQINPDSYVWAFNTKRKLLVSIVSIQADQSRHSKEHLWLLQKG